MMRLFFFHRLSKVMLIVFNALISVEALLDDGEVFVSEEISIFWSRFETNDALNYVLLEHEVLDTLLAMNKIKVATHDILLAFFTHSNFEVWWHLITTSTGLLEATEKLGSLGPWKFGKASAMGDTLCCAPRWVFDWMTHLHHHKIIHSKLRFGSIIKVVIYSSL